MHFFSKLTYLKQIICQCSKLVFLDLLWSKKDTISFNVSMKTSIISLFTYKELTKTIKCHNLRETPFVNFKVKTLKFQFKCRSETKHYYHYIYVYDLKK